MKYNTRKCCTFHRERSIKIEEAVNFTLQLDEYYILFVYKLHNSDKTIKKAYWFKKNENQEKNRT